MTAAAARILASLVTDKRFWKVVLAVFLILVLIITAAGSSCTAHNLQIYASDKVAVEFAPQVTSINSQIEDGQLINTQLLYSIYITLFDNRKYPDKNAVRGKLLPCFYTKFTKEVPIRDDNGNTVLDEDGKPMHKTITIVKAIPDSTAIFKKVEESFNITISETERQYILNLAQLFQSSGSLSLSEGVHGYQTLVCHSCAKYGIAEYSGLVLAIMQAESGGSGGDPMQSSECPLNTKYPHTPKSITDPEYSVNIGVQYFESCLRAAKCKSPQDITGMSLALQGYNYGGGYIDWAKKRDGGYTPENAQAFSEMKKKQLGVSVYGNPNYAQRVLSYYNQTSNNKFIFPIQKGLFTISSPFGLRIDPIAGKSANHKGIDLAASSGTPICAGADGIVIYAQFGNYPYGGYGNVVVIRHSSTLISLYGHCSKLLVAPGQTVQKGQLIALVGSTGNSTGNHCHFEIRVNGTAVNPLEYLK